jgi:hypothetical protein
MNDNVALSVVFDEAVETTDVIRVSPPDSPFLASFASFFAAIEWTGLAANHWTSPQGKPRCCGFRGSPLARARPKMSADRKSLGAPPFLIQFS